MDFLTRVFYLDIRSLAVFRIGLSLILIYDTLQRFSDFAALISDSGVLPLSVVAAENWEVGPYLIYFISSSNVYHYALLISALLFATFLLIGWKTKFFCFLSWFFLVSIHSRNPLVLTGGDFFLKIALFWAIFLPIGSYWSIDARDSKNTKALNKASLATAAFILQLCLVYWFSLAHKSGEDWRISGNAAFIALSFEQLTTEFGSWLKNFPSFLRITTFSTLLFELIGPFLILIPDRRGVLRAVIPLLFISMHLVFLLCFSISFFPVVCIVVWLALIPSEFWEKVKIGGRLDLEQLRRKLNITNIFILFAFFISFLCNLESLTVSRYYPDLHKLNELKRESRLYSFYQNSAILLRLNQSWHMFAPNPTRIDGWYVAVGHLENGEAVDLFNNNKSISWEKPKSILKTFKNSRWRKYLRHLSYPQFKRFREHYLKYLCNHSEAESVELYFMREQREFYKVKSNPEKVLLGKLKC